MDAYLITECAVARLAENESGQLCASSVIDGPLPGRWVLVIDGIGTEG